MLVLLIVLSLICNLGKKEFSPNEDPHVIADCVKVLKIQLNHHFCEGFVEGFIWLYSVLSLLDKQYIIRELPSSPVPASCCNALLEAFSKFCITLLIFNSSVLILLGTCSSDQYTALCDIRIAYFVEIIPSLEYVHCGLVYLNHYGTRLFLRQNLKRWCFT